VLCHAEAVLCSFFFSQWQEILHFEQEEEARDREVDEVRLRHINLLTQLRQLEGQVKQKVQHSGISIVAFIKPCAGGTC